MASPAGILGDQRLPALHEFFWVLHLTAAELINAHLTVPTHGHTHQTSNTDISSLFNHVLKRQLFTF